MVHTKNIQPSNGKTTGEKIMTKNNDAYDKLYEIIESLEFEQGRLYDLAQEILAENSKGEDNIQQLKSVLDIINTE